MRLSESGGPWTFTPIKVEPASSRQQCGVPRGHRRQGVQPVRPAALFGSHSESAFPMPPCTARAGSWQGTRQVSASGSRPICVRRACRTRQQISSIEAHRATAPILKTRVIDSSPSKRRARERHSRQGWRITGVSAVMINDHMAFRIDWMPFAGRHESGYGIGGFPCGRMPTPVTCSTSRLLGICDLISP